MRKYVSIDKHMMSDSTLYFVRMEEDTPREELNRLLTGERVLIDGKEHLVRAVESQLMTVIYKGNIVGLLT